MYRTPPNARGFQAHFDFEDVFIVQVSGSKRWRVWEPDPSVGMARLPIKEPRTEALRSKDYVPSLRPRSVELLAGDVLYIPRGHPHMAETGMNHSLHLTVTLMDQDITWEKLLQGLVLTGDPQSWPVAYEVGSTLGARRSCARESLWRDDPPMLQKLQAAFQGCEFKQTARNVSFADGVWVAASVGEGADAAVVGAGSLVTVEAVMLSALHHLVSTSRPTVH